MLDSMVTIYLILRAEGEKTMAQWYVKELSKLTHVSVQTLHHYDHIGLLTPSVRLPNGYRLYSEKDLLKLQQIIALKFFSFELSQIKELLNKEIDLLEHLSKQSTYLQKQAEILFEASTTLKDLTASCRGDKSIPWEKIIKSIEVYRMIQQLEKSWEGKVFNSDELKEYARFEQEMKNKFSEKELQAITNRWEKIIDDVNANLKTDPTSETGILLGQRTMEWVNQYYGKKHIALRNAIWEKGFKEGNMPNENALSQETCEWLDKAITAYYQTRTLAILNQIESKPHEKVLQQWEALLIDMYGDEAEQKHEFLQTLFNDKKIDPVARDWIKQYMEKK